MGERKLLASSYINKRLIVISCILGVLFGFFSVFGNQLENNGNVNLLSVSTYIYACIASLIAGVIVLLLILVCDWVDNHLEITLDRQWTYKLYFMIAGLLFLAWVPQLLGAYPGFFNYDAPGQWQMYISGEVTAHHPVLHTMIFGKITEFFYDITGAFNKAVFAFVLIQAFIIGNCFLYVIKWMYCRGVARGLIIASFLWFAFFPTVVINVFSITKDSLFSAFFLLFLVMTLDMFEKKEVRLNSKLFMFAWIIITFLTMILRNNAVYVMTLFLVVLLFVMRKQRKKMFCVIGGVAILYFFYIGIFCPYYTVDGVNSKEFLSVPTQQMVRVYKTENKNLSQDEKEIYESLFDEIAIEYYNPKISDIVKSRFNMDLFESNQSKYISFYLEQGKKFPDVYMNSFLQNTYGFWYPKASLVLDMYGWEGYFMCHSYPPAQNNSLIPKIGDYFILFENSSLVQGDSVSVIFFAPATYFWILLFTMGYVGWKKRKNEFILLTFVLLLWMTYLLGPVVLVRYVSFLFYIIPMIIVFLFYSKK